MSAFESMAALRAACVALPGVDADAEAAALARQAVLTKPAGSLGRLEELAVWLAGWQRRAVPRLDAVDILVFAGNHGVVAQGVSPFPAEVTGQMVGNFTRGGAAIWQLTRLGEARLRVVPLSLERPTADITMAPAMDEAEFLEAVSIGYEAVEDGTDLVCLGEMGIGNTTAAAALASGLFGGSGADWAGRGTGLDEAGVARKAGAIDRALERVGSVGPLEAAREFGGRELAALLGAALGARHRRVPVMLDGFVCTASVAPLARLAADGLAHCRVAHRSAERGHERLVGALGMRPLLDLDMRLGEASGAAVGLLVARAAVACHAGMATFAEAGVSDRPGAPDPN
jgi:nicotinate-nucleotide--dimethylbenzimidazole phosphoribosyltransferase